MMQRTNLDR